MPKRDPDEPMPEYIGQTYIRERIVLDGKQFYQCRFKHCLLEFGATERANLADVHFEDTTQVLLTKHAILTLAFLHQLYLGGMKDYVEGVFDRVRTPMPGETADEPENRQD